MTKQFRFPYGIPRVSLLAQQEEVPTMLDKIRARLSRYLPETKRELMHRLIAATVGTLLAAGLLTSTQAELWTRLGLSSISLLFAWLYARDTLRAWLYGTAVTVGGLLYAYGVSKGVDWALIVATFGQGLGVATAAAKAVPAARIDVTPSAA